VTRASWRRLAFRAAGWFVVILIVSYAVVLASVGNSRIDLTVQSAALGETRKISVYGAAQGAVSIYSLDGDKTRHSLLPAAHGAIIAWLSGDSAPMVVAVHAQGTRDIDLRPETVEPAYWRPDIKGRGPAFDAFLLKELRGEIEKRFGRPKKRYFFGHSLAGLYAIDMASRQADHGFDGLFAFTPTFSHDLSLLNRLGKACEHSAVLYANIGLESRRDTAVFERARVAFANEPACKANVNLSWHPGMIHQTVMVTGQVEALNSIF
jgi:predicted alpha/beta superfamily hydrolase